MRWLLPLLLLLPQALWAQSRTVLPGELGLSVEVVQTDHTPFAREMVLITIRGIYRRHITREKLVQPDLKGFSWSQLGDDTWRNERINGEQVKTFRRRMAIYPDGPGTLTVGAFRHELTLTDEGDDWFEHSVSSEPFTIEVLPAPAGEDWWFPVKTLKVDDQWSNAPDQLAPGEGVLRVIRVEALGVTPEMIPPMPTLTSPSAMIFPHPEKRFVELSPHGPTSVAFWRWTIRPGNDTSAIVEPLSFAYYDTFNRVSREVTISAQRVAYGSVVSRAPTAAADPASPARLPGWPVALLAAVTAIVGVAAALQGHRITGLRALRRFALFDPLARGLRRAARQADLPALRRHAAALLARDGSTNQRRALLDQLDRALFDPAARPPQLHDFARSFLNAGGRTP